MSKCSVFRTLKSKCSHWTLLRPKYCALSDVETKSRKRTATPSLRIGNTSPLKTLDPFLPPRLQVRCRDGQGECYYRRPSPLLRRGERAGFMEVLRDRYRG